MDGKRLIFGLGTGRCGTNSLARLLGMQGGTNATHECWPLPWVPDVAGLERYLGHLRTRSGHAVQADVGLYLLQYAEVLAGIGAKLVVLERARAEVVASFERKVPRFNHWQRHDGKRWSYGPWDPQFPKYKAASRAEAIGLYWDEYRERAAGLCKRHPKQVRVFQTELLGDGDALRELLHWLGYEEPVIPAEREWENRTHVAQPGAWKAEDLAVVWMGCPREPSYFGGSVRSFMSDPGVSKLAEVAVAWDAPDGTGLPELPGHWRVVPTTAVESARVVAFQLHRKACHNYWRALGLARPGVRGVLVLEDDVAFRERWLEKLLEALTEMEGAGLREFILAAYSAYDHEQPALRRGRCYSSYPAGGFFGTQAVFYTAGEAAAARDIVWRCGVESYEEPYDLLVKRRALERQHLYATRHSLAQHVGGQSTGLGSCGHTSPSFEREWPEPPPGTLPVPRVIHQVWVGGKPLPQSFERWRETVRAAMPDWEYRLWTEENLAELLPKCVCRNLVEDRSLFAGFRADVIRYELMLAFGGVYLDLDFELFRSIEPLLLPGCAHYADQRPGDPAVGFLASVPGHGLWRRILGDLRHRGCPKSRDGLVEGSGPGALRRALRAWCSPHPSQRHEVNGEHVGNIFPEAVVAFYEVRFYPYWMGTMMPENFQRDRFPKAWAVHHWAASWAA